ncbi:hypothetical protein ACLB2K_075521 [Fragaria x ananassa]
MAGMQIVLASKTSVEAQYVEMMVPLYSPGCEKKVKKALSDLKGIYSVNVDYSQQKVTVWGICNKYDVLATVRTKRKHACFWNPEDNDIGEEGEEETEQPPTTTMSESDDVSTPPIAKIKSLLRQPSIKALTRVRSLSLKAWKNVFTRSYSFS